MADPALGTQDPPPTDGSGSALDLPALTDIANNGALGVQMLGEVTKAVEDLTATWPGLFPVSVNKGGTGLTSVVQGDLLYGSVANVYALLAKDATATRYLSNTGPSNNPAWAPIDLTNGVTGALPIGNIGDIASVANVRAATANKLFVTDLIETASAGVALTDAATVAVDWDAGINFTLTVTANRVIGNPTNGQPGTWRTILVQGNDATDRTITFASQYLGDVPTITNADSTRWFLLMIYCVTTTHFVVSSKRALGTA